MGCLLPNVVLLGGEVHPLGTQDQTSLSLWKNIAKSSPLTVLLFSHGLLHSEQLLTISCLNDIMNVVLSI